MRTGMWTDEEERLFHIGFRKYGSDWAKIADLVKSRTKLQVQYHSKSSRASLTPARTTRSKSVSLITPSSRPKNASLPPLVAQINKGAWSDEESRLFLVGLKRYSYGDWDSFATLVKTRSKRQIASRASTFFKRMKAGENIFADLEDSDDLDEGTLTANPKRKNRVSLSPSSMGISGRSRCDYENETDADSMTDNSTPKKRRAVSNVVPSSRSTKKPRKATWPDASKDDSESSTTMGSVSNKEDAAVASALSSESTNNQQVKTLRVPSAKKTVTVLGATGGTGMCLVKQALDGGHNVRALVRNPDKFPFGLSLNKNLTVSVGDVTKYEDVEAVINGCTDVIVSLGGHGKDGKICSTAQPVIDKVLNDVDPNIRMVVVTSMAAGDSYYDVTWMTRRFVDLVLASTIKDKNLQERSVIQDTTNWVIVRPVGLSDGPLTGTAEGDAHAAPAASKTIARADLAHFILNRCLSGQDEWKRNPVTVFPPQ